MATPIINTNLGKVVTATGNIADDLSTLRPLLNEKVAKVDGAYPDLTAGALLSASYRKDTTPYLFKSAYKNSARMRENKIVGATVAWNQLLDTGVSRTINDIIFTVDSAAGTIRVNGTASADASYYFKPDSLTNGFKAPNGHKILFKWNISGSDATKYYISLINNGGVSEGLISTTRPTGGIVTIIDETKGSGFVFRIRAGQTVDITIPYPNIHDLTLMFGSTIADAIYAMEQAEEGSGVAFLKSHGFLTKPYYDYNAGTLISVNPTAHKMTGFNQFNELWELGSISDSDGQNAVNNNYGRSKDYLRVVPNTGYYFKLPFSDTDCHVYFYDADKNYISWAAPYNHLVTTPSNCFYLRFRGNGWTSYNYDVNVNIHWDGERDGEYEAYEEHTYALDAKTTENPSGDLRGLFKIVNGELVADGDEYTSDGKVQRKYGIMDLGSLSWNKVTGHAAFGDYFYADIIAKGVKYEGTYAIAYNALCSQYPVVGRASGVFVDKTLCLDGSNEGVTQVEIKDSAYSDAATLKTALTNANAQLVYQLKTPTEEQATPYTKIQVSNEWGTMEYVDERSVPIPVGHDTDALANVAENIPMPPTANGTYVLKATMADGVASYAWVAE